MKKTLFTILLVGLFSSNIFAQGDNPFPEGSLLLNAGLSLGYINSPWGTYSGADRTGFVPITANVEYSFHEMFSVGPYVGFHRIGWENEGTDYYWRFNYFQIGARGTWHASQFLNEEADMNINTSKLDIYASVQLGLESRSFKTNVELVDDYTNTELILGPVIGARYLFTPKIGGFAELGRGTFGWFTFGISARLK